MNSAKEKILDMICDYIEKNPEGNIEDIVTNHI